MKKRALIAAGIMLSVLVIDQIVKYCVKTSMLLHEDRAVCSWFHINFTENRGMAFGMDFVGGTLVLALFRLATILLFIWFLCHCIRKERPLGLICCLSLIVAGALGNIIDNAFYGLVYTASPEVYVPFASPAHLVPMGEGYGSFFTGRVVDMFYFPLFHWPEWVPFVGGNVFFGAIFNFADAAISVGCVALVLFYASYLRR